MGQISELDSNLKVKVVLWSFFPLSNSKSMELQALSFWHVGRLTLKTHHILAANVDTPLSYITTWLSGDIPSEHTYCVKHSCLGRFLAMVDNAITHSFISKCCAVGICSLQKTKTRYILIYSYLAISMMEIYFLCNISI